MKTMSKFGLLIIVISTLVIASCSTSNPKMDEAKIEEMILVTDRGLISGLDIGDTWDEIKSNCSKDWTIDEVDENNKILRKDWTTGFDFIIMELSFYENNVLSRIRCGVYGTKDNAIVAKTFFTKATNYFDKKLNKTSTDNWEYTSKDNKKYSVNCSNMGNSDNNMVEQKVYITIKPMHD